MAAERPTIDIKNAKIIEHEVKYSSTVRKGCAVKFDTNDVVEVAAVGDDGVGIALDAGTSPASGTKVRVRVAYFGFPAVVHALVGTGGCTKGNNAKYASDGCINATIGGGTTKLVTYGQFLETGAVGDYAALNIARACATVGS